MMLQRHYSLFTLFFILLTILTYAGCDDDDMLLPGEASLLPYDAAKHVYGTIQVLGDGKWEVVIDPTTGDYEKIEETEDLAGGFSDPLGARSLTSFSTNSRIAISFNSSANLEVQDLTTFVIDTIKIRDAILEETIFSTKLIRFGANDQEILVLGRDESLWRVDLTTKLVTKIYDRIPVDSDCGIKDVMYIPSSDKYLVLNNTDNVVNNYSVEILSLVDPNLPEEDAVITALEITKGFGFVQDPTEDNIFFYIQQPDEDSNFRLWRGTVVGSNIGTNPVSTEDLPIDNLSFFLQTIHSATNTYILRGGSNSLESPNNFLYSIDLDSGELIREVELLDSGILMKIKGE